MDPEAPVRLDEIGVVGRKISTIIANRQECIDTQGRVTSVTRGGLSRQRELGAIFNRRSHRVVDDDFSGCQEPTVVDKKTTDLSGTERGSSGTGDPRRDQESSSPNNPVVFENEIGTLNEIVVERDDATPEDFRDIDVCQVVECVLPGIEVVLEGNDGTNLGCKRQDYSPVLTVNLSRDNLHAVHANGHLGGVRGGDATIGTVNDGTIEREIGLVTVGALTLGEAQDHIGRTIAHEQIAVCYETDSRKTKVVRVLRCHQGRASRSTIDQRDNGSGSNSSDGERSKDDLVLVAIHSYGEYVCLSSELVQVADSTVDNRARRSRLIREIIRNQCIRTLEEIRNAYLIAKRRGRADLDDTNVSPSHT